MWRFFASLFRGSAKPNAPAAIVYTRRGCGLCEEAAELLRDEGWRVEMVDIDADQELLAKYDHDVPVVVIGGVERFRGRVNRVLLRRLKGK